MEAPLSLRGPLGVLAVLLVVTLAGLAPPAPRPAEAPPEVFSAARALAELEALDPADAPHPVASPANARVRDHLLARLRDLGLEPEVQAGFSCARGACSWVENVLARIPGEAPGPAVLLAAHYDTRAPAPGAADAGAGVAALLEIARALRHRPPPRDVLLLFDDGEEGGLHGARLFVREDPRHAEVAAMVNLEARGTAGPSMMFETSEGNAGLIAWFARAASRPVASSLYFTIYRVLPNDTDLTVFKAAGTRGLNFAFLGAAASYHTPRDDRAHLDRGSLQHHGQNALELVRAADSLPAPSPGNAVYFDIAGRVLVHLPASAGLPLALLGLALCLARAAAHGPRPIGAALAGWLVGLGGSALLLAATHGALLQAGVAPARWIAHPGPLLASQWLLGVGLAAAVASRTGRAGRDAYWLGMALLGAAAAAFTPGLAYLLWVPALAAGLAGARAPRLAWAVFAALWLPHAALLYTALGIRLPGLHGLVAWLMAAPLGAALAGLGRRAATAGGVVLLGLMAAALAVPPFSPEVPCPLTLRYVEDSAAGAARWELLTFLPAPPPALAAAAPFAPTGAPYGGLHSRVASFRAAAAPCGLAPPRVEGSELEALPGRPGWGRWAFRIRSVRGARRLGLTLPEGARVGAVRLLSEMAYEGADASLAEPHDLEVRLPAGRELEVALEVPLDHRPDLRVWDISDDLPPGGEAVRDARPAWAVPAHDADHCRVEAALAPPSPGGSP